MNDIDDLPLHGKIAAPTMPVGEFMYMPAGVHSGNFEQGSKAVRRTINVEPSAVNALNAQIAALKAGKHKPYFDFNHDDKEASFWPEEFSWRDAPDPGIYVRGEWSEAGIAAIKGKQYRSFSPVFYTDKSKPSKITCRPDAMLNMGGLVNDPAFREISPLWAKNAGAPGVHQHQPHHTTMTKDNKAALQAAKSQLEKDIEELSGQPDSAEKADAISAKRVELENCDTSLALIAQAEENLELKKALLAHRTEKAEAAVNDAIRKGVIPSKDEAMKARWKEKCIDDPKNIDDLKALKGNQTLSSARIIDRISMTRPEIIRESNADVLNAFGLERDPRRRAAIFAKEIRDRVLKEGDDMPLKDLPLKGANSLATLAGTLVSQRTLELLHFSFPDLKGIWTDFSDQIVSYGDVMKTRIVSIPAVQTYNQTTGWAASDMTTADVSITYDKFKAVPISIDAQSIAGTVRRLFDEIAQAQAYALGKDMVDSAYALIVIGTFTNATTQALVGFGRAAVISMGVALQKRGVPQGPMNRTLLLNSDYFGGLAQDTAIVTLAGFQQPGIITDGILPNVHGFRVVDAPNLPATGNLTGFGFSKSALVIASRLSADYVNAIPGAGNGNAQVITDPNTGLSVNQIQYVDHKLGTANQRLEFIYGVAAGQASAGQILKSA